MLYLIIALAIIAGSAIVGLTGAYFIRAKRSEDAEAQPRPNIASSAAPQKIEEEVKTIGEQIEKAMSDQRLQGETQRQLLSQKLDSVRQSVETQRHQVEGLRNEFRHEAKRRDHEIEQIRSQIGTIQQTVGISAGTPPPAALPPASEPTPEVPEASPFFSVEDPPDAELDATTTDEADASPFEEFTFAEAAPPAAPELEPTHDPDAEAGPDARESGVLFAEEFSFAEPATDQPSTDQPSFEEPPFEEVPFKVPPASDDAVDLDAPAPPAAEAAPDEDETIDDVTFEEATFDESAFEEATFEDVSFEEDPLASGPVLSQETFVEPDFTAIEPPEANGEDPADPFATAPLHDEPVGGDSAAAGDVLDTWSPAPPTTSTPEPPAVEAVQEGPDVMPEPVSDDETAWIARPSAPDVARPVVASPDDFIMFSPSRPSMPAPAPEPAPEPAGLVDLDALTGTPDLSAPAPDASEEPAPEIAATAPVPTAASEPAAIPQSDDAGEPAVGTVAHAEPATDAEPEAYAEPEAAAEADTEPANAAPEGAEDLTIITTIDEDTQRRLYEVGVLTLDEIAQWGRGDARRIGSRVQVTEDTIMNQWVFEAQAALFQRYSQQVGA